MKKVFNNIVCGVILLFGLTACVHDLNVTPIDPSVNMEVNQDALFNKIYATLALTGQSGPDGNGDVDGIDEGTSAFYRMIFELNEFPADGGFWNWYDGDPGINELYNLTWKSTNDLVTGLYYRLYFDITLCNHFLELFSDATDDKTKTQVAEVRLIRAMNYYYLLDMFQDVPFAERVTTEKPKQITRAELYNWLETELLELENLLPPSKLSEYRMDVVAAQFLLMRVYLNSEVYINEAKYNEAAEYAHKVISSNYKLSPKYNEMFMGDNHLLGNASATSEFILSIYQGVRTESWGGSRFLVNATRDAGNMPNGSDDSWSCFRSSPSLFIGPWFTESEALGIKATAQAAGYDFADEYAMPILAGDDRCMLAQSSCNNGTGVATFDCDLSEILKKLPKVGGDNGATFGMSWTICKWTGVYSNGQMVGEDPSFPDTNIPFFRASEAYLSYAEAVYRGGASQGMSAQEAIQALRDRANNTKTFTIDDDFLLDEWQREFYCEGRRRTDLVRFGRFTSGDYLWEGKIGAVDARFNVYPIPNTDIVANSNLKQYLGY